MWTAAVSTMVTTSKRLRRVGNTIPMGLSRRSDCLYSNSGKQVDETCVGAEGVTPVHRAAHEGVRTALSPWPAAPESAHGGQGLLRRRLTADGRRQDSLGSALY